MFHRILVPLDGSERAERALPVAVRLARASHGTLIVVQVLDIDTTLYIAPEMMISESVVHVESSRAGQYLIQATAALKQEGIPIEQCVLLGIPASMLLSAITSYNADLVVMCSHGRTGFLHWALGSVAEKMARISPVPVLILREHGSILAGPHPDPTRPLRALVPLDGSTASKAAMAPAAALIAALAAPASGALHLTRVVQPATSERMMLPYQRNMDDMVQKTKHSLQKTAENVRDGFEAPSVTPLGLRFTCSVALDTDVAHALIRVAENGEDAEGAGIFGGCDVIAMATHGRTGIDRLALGSVTERVLHATRLPLLVVPISRKTLQNSADEQQYSYEHSGHLPCYELSK
ncbi:MAG: universal stress protein [Ktedonobacteraceae bacterium]|nr:universal stress protein [Ktedonobacteraceae bacterium]